MEKRKIILGAGVALVAIILVMAYFSREEMIIGGERDENGCLAGAGYGWNESEKECVREWETGQARYQVSDFDSCEAAGYPIMESYPRQCSTEGGRTFVELDLDGYFSDQMWRRGVENLNGAHPVEGFNPALYIGAYPGLQKTDFDGVSAIGGKWELRNEELFFVSDGDNLISSADGTIDEAGMKILMEKLEDRLGIEIENEEDVDEMINVLSEAE